MRSGLAGIFAQCHRSSSQRMLLVNDSTISLVWSYSQNRSLMENRTALIFQLNSTCHFAPEFPCLNTGQAWLTVARQGAC